MPPSPQTTKLTSTLHLLIPRLRLLQKKDTASSVIQRRDLSSLLAEGRDSSARIRVENVIATDIAVEAMEMIELYCELLLARANVLDQAAFGEKGAVARNRARLAASAAGGKHSAAGGAAGAGDTASGSGSGGGGGRFSFFGLGGAKHPPNPNPSSTSTTDPATEPSTTTEDPTSEEYIDPALDEAAAVIFYAYPRFPHDVRELTILRNLLAERWGKEFMALAQEDAVPGVRVPARVVKVLRVRAPSAELVDCYLREIARAYGVSWGAHLVEGDAPTISGLDGSGDDLPGHDGDDEHAPGDDPSTPTRRQRSPIESEARRASETLALNKATPPRGLQQGKSFVSVAPPGARVDNLHPRVKVPGAADYPPSTTTVGEAAGVPGAKAKSEIPELDELTRRFAALRR
ncbi:hypothetical protein ASPACDRAFT_1884347 [Aspergillus aculeatus ATCC 16872]|uniref:DUF292 domain protein n=1 Tax=Aspergillus aculeatus (strain ATCC 16872 / CBS 172.66 / WB 5094) TaxID=690307 RepID=A0A1L9X8D0_ASPA1|nr:uncharacterized protein ASPACDRAFT_1884347 [Aspergillus aculeatus ATCC 16872]OJK04692.1 hypothetical protein ASPACDRAFT_1884347 [Aspergillus aculeatus ATCC 16872]